MERAPRLDILIYAHDGRGLGHASRSIAIGMALRRLYPQLRVLFVTGCKVSQELIGQCPLDWLKLPSYETEVIGGKSTGRDGHSNFTDKELGILRGEELKSLFLLYRPKVVLCDHSPQGKHRELLPILRAERPFATQFILGVRGVIGKVTQIQSPVFQEAFRHFHSVLWYGDENILGKEHRIQLEKYCKKEPVECGYVSRLRELKFRETPIKERGKDYLATVSIPWLGEHSLKFLDCLHEAVRKIGPKHGGWRFFIGCDEKNEKVVLKMFQDIPFCILEKPSGRYIDTLQKSKIAVVYGGYNSLMDILHLAAPSLVVLRGMADNEQQLHLLKLQNFLKGQLRVCEEDNITSSELYQLLQQLIVDEPNTRRVNLNGAEVAASYLADIEV